jgi:hypothetical protein
LPLTTLDQVNQWLGSKLALVVIPLDLEEAATARVKSVLASRYDTSTWTTPTNTPTQVRTVISLYTAAWAYDRQYAEDAVDVRSYGSKLEERAGWLLQSIVDSGIQGVTPTSGGQPLFWPTDAATDLGAEDPTNPDAAPRFFEAKAVF